MGGGVGKGGRGSSLGFQFINIFKTGLLLEDQFSHVVLAFFH